MRTTNTIRSVILQQMSISYIVHSNSQNIINFLESFGRINHWDRDISECLDPKQDCKQTYCLLY